MKEESWAEHCVRAVRELRARNAIAAATGTAKTPQAAECEASQSGPKGIAQKRGQS